MIQSLPILHKEHDIDIATTYYFLGPSISPTDYKVSSSHLWQSIRAQPVESVPTIGEYLKRDNEQEFFDVPCMILSQLQSIGVPKQNIQLHPSSTADATALFFSNFIDRPKGVKQRFMSVVGYV